MRVGVISDTHDNVAAIERATDLFREEGIETLVHCGDFIAPPVLPFFEGFSLHGVLGNNDGEVAGLESGFEAIGGELHGRFADLELGGKRFAVLHGESKEEVEGYAASGEYDYVCYGHHHERERRVVDKTLVVNPGAHFPTVPEEHRTVAVVDTESRGVEFYRV
ncbi:phosphodiesterase [Halalkalicoccus paucihalophilus]|uniref:Phosphoesterase n=1 Tax=Halalkalicoccus paucihalophilus TaxID=1008153 RepID=A0A151AJ82_9EURY|nr:metallophosphoesterase [Halalkalicoccus paucihalophilus]KYH27728.1 phosphodiesterase [Halalkalicoccus paucihalophilus]